MTDTQTARTPADRQRACRRRKRESGSPLISTFDRALREALFARYQAGDLAVDIPDVVRTATELLTASGSASERLPAPSCRPCWHVPRRRRCAVSDLVDVKQFTSNMTGIQGALRAGASRAVRSMAFSAKDRTRAAIDKYVDKPTPFTTRAGAYNASPPKLVGGDMVAEFIIPPLQAASLDQLANSSERTVSIDFNYSSRTVRSIH